MELTVEKLKAEAFAPYGDVIALPTEPGRRYFSAALGSARPEARPSLSTVLALPTGDVRIAISRLERHEHSSQSFVPIDVARWLVVVCPPAPAGGPDASRARAFLAGPDHGVTYRMNTWHHELTVLDRPSRFAIFMWLDGGAGDEEIVPVEPFTVIVGE